MRNLRQANKKNAKPTKTNEINGVASIVSNSSIEIRKISNDQITSSENLQTKSFDSMILAPSTQTKRKIIDKSKKQNEKKQLLFKNTDSTALTTEMLETLHSNLKVKKNSILMKCKFPWRKRLISEELKSKVMNMNHLQV